jgi:acyl CoA:acetate/3-ketoacid CoA transferase beta subunit
MDPRVLIVKRAAQALKDGQVVNLGFGMPTQALNYLAPGVRVMFHGENGVIGIVAETFREMQLDAGQSAGAGR